jgi:transcriptional regulator with XRE-family HTH domain
MARDLKSHIGVAVRAARERKGWTQEQLAELVEKATETISNIERGSTATGLATLERLAHELGVPVREFFPDGTDHWSGSVERLRKEQELITLARRLSDRELDVALRQVRAFLGDA